MRKQTKLWKTKDGRKIRICDMSDSHLINTIKFLNRAAENVRNEEINAAESMSFSLQGEMALDAIDAEIRWLYDSRPDAANYWRIYKNLMDDVYRRNLKLTK